MDVSATEAKSIAIWCWHVGRVLLQLAHAINPARPSKDKPDLLDYLPEAVAKGKVLDCRKWYQTAHWRAWQLVSQIYSVASSDPESGFRCGVWVPYNLGELWQSLKKLPLPANDLETGIWEEFRVNEQSEIPVELAQWVPASDAVESALALGCDVTLDEILRAAEKGKIASRPATLPGRHKQEVEWGRVLIWLVKDKQLARTPAGHASNKRAKAEPSKKQQTEITKRIQDVQAARRQQRPLD